jgi:hypothetical protein
MSINFNTVFIPGSPQADALVFLLDPDRHPSDVLHLRQTCRAMRTEVCIVFKRIDYARAPERVRQNACFAKIAVVLAVSERLFSNSYSMRGSELLLSIPLPILRTMEVEKLLLTDAEDKIELDWFNTAKSLILMPPFS